MKYIKYLLLSIPFFLVSIIDVNASSTIDYKSLSSSQNVHFVNCTSNNDCWHWVGDAVHQTPTINGNVFSYWKMGAKLTTIPNSAGVGVSFHSDTGFIKGNVYTVNVLLNSSAKATAYTTNTTKRVGVGITLGGAYDNPATFIHQVSFSDIKLDFYGTNITIDSGRFSYLSYTFKANTNGSYVFLTFTTETTSTDYWGFVGYSVTDHGNQAPTTEDIKNSLNSSFNSVNNNINNVQSNINSSINNAQNSINNNINDMKNNIDNSINSEDDDVNSSKCGIVCKLKNIVSGIVNLPIKIWEKLKVGFELITGAIGDFCDSIINIFIPEPECNKSSNLITYDLNYQFGPNSITYEVLDDGGIKFNGVCGTLGVTTTANCTFRFNLEESNFDGTLSFYANKKVQRGYISVGNISIDMAVFTLGSYLTGSSYGTINRSFYDIILNRR